MTASSRRQHKALQAISCVAVACALTALSVPAQAQPVSSSSLYYRMGGGSPSGMVSVDTFSLPRPNSGLRRIK